MRSLNWSLSAIAITEAECTKIMASILISVLAKLQIVSTIKRDVLYGPVYLQCMGFKSFYTLLGAIYCSIMIQICNIDTDLGRLL